jgi:hypothetical protein
MRTRHNIAGPIMTITAAATLAIGVSIGSSLVVKHADNGVAVRGVVAASPLTTPSKTHDVAYDM